MCVLTRSCQTQQSTIEPCCASWSQLTKYLQKTWVLQFELAFLLLQFIPAKWRPRTCKRYGSKYICKENVFSWSTCAWHVKRSKCEMPSFANDSDVPRVYLMTVPVTRAASRPQTAYPGSILSGSILRVPKSWKRAEKKGEWTKNGTVHVYCMYI